MKAHLRRSSSRGPRGWWAPPLAASLRQRRALKSPRWCGIRRSEPFVKLPRRRCMPGTPPKAPPPEGGVRGRRRGGQPRGRADWRRALVGRAEEAAARQQGRGHAGARRCPPRPFEAPGGCWSRLSGTGYYGDQSDDPHRERRRRGQGFLAELARDWEAEALQSASEPRHAGGFCSAAASCSRRGRGWCVRFSPCSARNGRPPPHGSPVVAVDPPRCEMG